MAANYRVKVDLSEFYSDAQKLSYIYIDSTKITNVLHLQTKIKHMFFINRPFYLAVNGVFLPISEDIRIIQNDEVVFVCVDPEKPAPLQYEVTVMSTPQSEKFSADKDLKIIEPSGSDETDDEVQVFHESKLDSSTNDVQLLDGSTSGRKKRKRVRRRKPKKEQNDSPLLTLTKNPLHNGFAANNQLTKIDIDTKPSHKHLKFNWDELEEVKLNVNETLTSINHSAKPVVRSTEVTSLKTLLNLRNCPRPMSFSAQKPVQKNSETSFNGNETLLVAKSTVEPMESIPATNKTSICTFPSDTDYSKLNFNEYPIYKDKFIVNDVMAFKILTMGSDYTPFLSDFIVARVDEILKENYVCTILFGSEQLKDPDGKFAIDIDEWSNGNKNDSVVMLNTAHLDQTRLIHRPSA